MTLAHHLVVFARTPRLGRVKTRLGRDIGAGAALAFYRLTLSSVLRRLGGNGGSDRGGGRRWRCWLAMAGAVGVGVLRMAAAKHYPSDVLAGLAAGTAAAFVVHTVKF